MITTSTFNLALKISVVRSHAVHTYLLLMTSDSSVKWKDNYFVLLCSFNSARNSSNTRDGICCQLNVWKSINVDIWHEFQWWKQFSSACVVPWSAWINIYLYIESSYNYLLTLAHGKGENRGQRFRFAGDKNLSNFVKKTSYISTFPWM